MADSDQQVPSPPDQPERPSLLADTVSNNYNLLLVAALLVLFVSLAVLVGFCFVHYGLGFKPPAAQTTRITANQVHDKLAQFSHGGHRVVLTKGRYARSLDASGQDASC